MTRIVLLQAAGAFALAAVWGLVLMPGAIAFGKKKGLTSRPRLFGRRRRKTITYVGGLILAATAALGLSLAGAMARESVVILGGATVLLLLGLADDRMTNGGVQPITRLVVETAVASVAWLGGLQARVFGVDWADGLLTVFFLVALVNSFNLLDNMDGVSGATALTVGIALLTLALVAGQSRVAVFAAAVAGASIGFLRHNLVKARVYLGNGGALFIGFLLGATALKLEFPFYRPWGFVALVAIFAVPATDTSLVVVSRLLARRSITVGGTDHISHRLVRLGLTPSKAATTHAFASLVGGAGALLAVATKRVEILILVVAVFAAFGLALSSVKVYEEELPSRGKVVALLAGLSLAIAPSLVMAALSRTDMLQARRSLLSAKSSFEKLEFEKAQSDLQGAEKASLRASRRLNSWLTWPGRLVPGLRGNLTVSTSLAQAGAELAGAGEDATKVLRALPSDQQQLWRDGSVDLKPLIDANESAARLAERVRRAESIVLKSSGVFLLPPVQAAREEAISLLSESRSRADTAVAATSLVPKLLGADGKRTWIIGAENTAELRGRGGYIGAFGVLEAEAGRLKLSSFRPATQLPPFQWAAADRAAREYRDHYQGIGALGAWPNLTMSPNLPSGAKLLVGQLEEQVGIKSDGIVVMDSVALADMVGVVGSVKVAGIPEPLTKDNATQWAVNKAYFQFEDAEQRKEHLGAMAQAIWERVVSGKDIDPKKLAEAITKMLDARHMAIYSDDKKEQKTIEKLGIAGAVSRERGDYLMVLGQNMGENKMDYYLDRRVIYRPRLLADGSIASVLEITVRNTAPTDVRLPSEVGGERPHLRLKEGRARSYVSVFIPQDSSLDSVRLDGITSRNFNRRLELYRQVISTIVELGPGESKRISLLYRVPDPLVDGRYRLTVQNQATVRPDQLSVELQIPKDSVLGQREGFAAGPGLRWSGPLLGDMVLASEVRTPLGWRIASKVALLLRAPVLGVQPAPTN